MYIVFLLILGALAGWLAARLIKGHGLGLWGNIGVGVAGALLGGAPLAQGTVYLLFSRRTAHVMAGVLTTVVAVAAIFVFLTPIQMNLVEPHRLTGSARTGRVSLSCRRSSAP